MCSILQRLVSPLVAVVIDVGPERLFGLPAVGVLAEVDLLLLHRPPEPLEEDVVERSATFMHGHSHAALDQAAREGSCRELGSLVSVEDLGRCPAERCVQGLDAEGPRQRVRQPPGKNVAAEEIHDGSEVEEPVLHWDGGDVARPHMVRPGNLQIPQQRGENLVPGRGPTSRSLGVLRLEPQQSHQPLGPLSVDAQVFAHRPRTVERPLRGELVDGSHQGQVVCRLALRHVVPVAPR